MFFIFNTIYRSSIFSVVEKVVGKVRSYVVGDLVPLNYFVLI